MQIGAIIQARMSSSRFPGKVLHNVAGKPVLQYLLERLEHCDQLDAVVVATSVDESDGPIEEFCRTNETIYYRGDLNDVAGRFIRVLDIIPVDVFVRINGDSPLLDQALIKQGIDIFLQNDYDLVTNVQRRTYPKGQSIEVLRRDTFEATYPLMEAAEDLEHVTKYFYKHQDNFRIFNFESGADYGDVQLSVDTTQDMEMFASIIAKMDEPHWTYSLADILSIYRDLTAFSQNRGG